MAQVLHELEIQMLPQPTDTTCGPTCLHAVYRWFGEDLPLDQVIAEAPMLEGGGTLAVMLGCHALARGYQATIYTWNLSVFDPTWFRGPTDLTERLRTQRTAKKSKRLRRATDGYLEFLSLGGRVRHEDLTGRLLKRHLHRGHPILTGLSATYLYQTARERDEAGRTVYDDIRGEPAGHFVVITGYDSAEHRARVVDPYAGNPMSTTHHYEVDLGRLVAAIFLGIVTYDANLLVLRPRRPHVHHPDRPQQA